MTSTGNPISSVREDTYLITLAPGVPILDCYVLSLNVAKLLEAVPESVEVRLWRNRTPQKTYARDFIRLLRLGRTAKCKEHSAQCQTKFLISDSSVACVLSGVQGRRTGLGFTNFGVESGKSIPRVLIHVDFT
jgi:hypothetical protein